jgi:hypothetical protein
LKEMHFYLNIDILLRRDINTIQHFRKWLKLEKLSKALIKSMLL